MSNIDRMTSEEISEKMKAGANITSKGNLNLLHASDQEADWYEELAERGKALINRK